MLGRTIILAGTVAVLASAALAQQPTAFTVRLEKGDRNASACTNIDGAMSRQHTVTIAGNIAVVKSNGGIDDKAKLTSPGIYKTKFSVSGATLDIVVDTTVSPPTLTATEAKIGCKWSGKAA